MKVLATATSALALIAVLVGIAAAGIDPYGSPTQCRPAPPTTPTDTATADLLAVVLTRDQRSPADDDTTAVLAAAGIDRPNTQLPNAALIIAAGAHLGAPPRAQTIAIATAMQETRLLNLANPAVPESLALPNDGTGQDHDSIGLFQQRPSMGWGTPAQLMDPTYAATTFYNRLLAHPGWETMPIAQAAQAVQRSGFPDAYARWETLAAAIVATTAGASACLAPVGNDVLVIGDHAFPVPISSVGDPARLLAPHHDYPAWDLGLPEGTPIIAPATGTIIAVTTSGACGWGIVLQDARGLQWNLCHGTPGSHQVTTGQYVTAGTTLFLSGNTGNSTGPHIHLGIRTPDGVRLCPQPWLQGLWERRPINPASLPVSGCTSGSL